MSARARYTDDFAKNCSISRVPRIIPSLSGKSDDYLLITILTVTHHHLLFSPSVLPFHAYPSCSGAMEIPHLPRPSSPNSSEAHPQSAGQSQARMSANLRLEGFTLFTVT
eukprot:750506-Hanusia_phi.AAC.5